MKKTITIMTVIFMTVSMISLSSLKGYSQITTYPYVQTGDIPVGWSVQQTTPLWSLANSAVNPAGVLNDPAIVCNFFSYAAGPTALLITPEFDFTALTSPVVSFYTSYTTYQTENDSLQFLVSVDGGATFNNVPTAYKRSYNSTPSLATKAPQITAYSPSTVSMWRYETVNLAAYAGNPSVVFAFRGVCDYGNNLWVDNFVVNDDDGYLETNVTAAGDYSYFAAKVTFNTIGLSPVSNQNSQNDNPSGGKLSFAAYIAQSPPTIASPEIAVNTTALNAGGTITNPNVIYQDSWYTISYTGNDHLGYANYDISLDVSGYSDISKLYVLKRADITAPWVCQNTVASGLFIKVSGLTTFADFAIAGDSISVPLPVELASFTSFVNNRNVNLNWITSSELNNAGFDIERRDARRETQDVWSLVGNVEGYGTSNVSHNYSFSDNNLNSGKYNYRLKQKDFNGNFEYFNLNSEVNVGTPNNFSLSQNYPNPFNPSTKINYDIPFDSKVSIKIFDMTGREVSTLLNESKTAGYYSINFNAGAIASGVYFYTITASGNGKNFVDTKKMLLVK